VFAGSVEILVDAESGSGTLTVRFVFRRALATGFGRAPGAICRVSGSGLVAPTL
jgi:hypothetical protein